jgi:hypothetical protein
LNAGLALDVPDSGGLFVARCAHSVAAVIVPPAVRGLGDLGCNPTVSDRTRSPDAAERTLRRIELWAHARLTGNFLSARRQRDVIKVFARHLFYVLGGEAWERAETSNVHGDAAIRELKRAVTNKHEETVLAAALAADFPALVNSSPYERTTRFIELARKFLHLVPRGSAATPSLGSSAGRGPDSPDWLCEFAIRLASEPAVAAAWAASSCSVGLSRLFETPTLARAARFLVLAVEREIQKGPNTNGGLYAGWDWQ